MNKRGNRTAGSSAPEDFISPEVKYKNIFDNAGEGIYQSSVSGQILDVNPALARSFGYGSPEEMKKNIKDVSLQIYADPEMRKENPAHGRSPGSVQNSSSGIDGRIIPWAGAMRVSTLSAMPKGTLYTMRAFFWISRTGSRWRSSSGRLTIFSNSG